jgi:DNA-binding transcriptional MerR regulator
MTLRELLTRFPPTDDGRPGLTERQVRYLIAEGFIPPPRGGRTYADYGDDHVAAIARYQRLRGLGLAPAVLKTLMAGGELVPVPLRPGLALLVDVAALRGQIDPQAMGDLVHTILRDLMRESDDADGEPRSPRVLS